MLFLSKIRKISNIIIQLLLKKKIYLSVSKYNFFLNNLIVIIIFFKKKIYIYADSFAFYRLIRQIKFYKLNKYINYPLNLVVNEHEYRFYKKTIYAKTKKINFIKKDSKTHKHDNHYFKQNKTDKTTILCPKTNSFLTANGNDLAKDLNLLKLLFKKKYILINHPKSVISNKFKKLDIDNETKRINSQLNIFFKKNSNSIYFTTSFFLIENLKFLKLYKKHILFLPSSKKKLHNRNYIFIHSLLKNYFKTNFKQLIITKI